MKLFKIILKKVRRVGLPVAAGFAVTLGAGSACAQSSIPLKIYPLANTLTGTNLINVTNGLTQLAPASIYTVACQPFQIWRGRGFTFNAGLIGTNGLSTPQGTLTAAIRLGLIHSIPGTSTLVTNWTTTNLTAVMVLTQTNEQFFSTNIGSSFVDNVSLGQLLTLANNNPTNNIWFDPTNAFIGVYP